MTIVGEGPAILLEPLVGPDGRLILQVWFAGLLPCTSVELSFVESDAKASGERAPRTLGKARGQLQGEWSQRLRFVPDEPPAACVESDPCAHFRFLQEDGDFASSLTPCLS